MIRTILIVLTVLAQVKPCFGMATESKALEPDFMILVSQKVRLGEVSKIKTVHEGKKHKRITFTHQQKIYSYKPGTFKQILMQIMGCAQSAAPQKNKELSEELGKFVAFINLADIDAAHMNTIGKDREEYLNTIFPR